MSNKLLRDFSHLFLTLLRLIWCKVVILLTSQREYGESAIALMCDSLVKNEKCKVKSRGAGSAYLFFGGEKTSRDGGLAASFSRKSASPSLFYPFEKTSEGGEIELGGRWTESGSAVRMATQRAASAIGVRCIGHRTALCFWRQTDACWCAVPFDSGLTAEQGRCREGKRTRSSLSQTEVGTLHPHISHLILARGIAPSHHSTPMQTAAERQWTRGRSGPACKTQRTAFAGAAFCVMHRSTERLRMRCAVRGPED